MFVLGCLLIKIQLISSLHTLFRNARYSTITTTVSHLHGSRNSVINEYTYVDCVVDQRGTEVNRNTGMSYLSYHLKCQVFQHQVQE